MSNPFPNFEGLPPEFKIQKLTVKQIEAISDYEIKTKRLQIAEKQSERESRLQTLVFAAITGLFSLAAVMSIASSFMGNNAEAVQKTSQPVMNITSHIVTTIAGYCFAKNSNKDKNDTNNKG